MPINNPCLDCGTPTAEGVRCESCRKAHDRSARRFTRRTHAPKKSATARGYNSAWARLSQRARQMQPFCVDCGSPDDLQADHTPEAWERKEKGLPIRLQDIAVVCGSCNRKRGAARGEHVTRDSKAMKKQNGVNTHDC